MIKINAYYYDGQSSTQVPVVITVKQTGEVLISGQSVEIKTTVKLLKISARLANTRRNIYLKDGSKLETEDNKAIDQICGYFDRNILQSLLHKLEKNWSVVLVALIITIIFVWGGIEYGVPFASKWAVKSVPYRVEQSIGEQGLESLDNWLFKETTMKNSEQRHLQKLFDNLVINSEKQFNYRLELRSAQKMGANALALPGGIIIMTDALIALAENDQQIIAVLAHEMAHIEYQHGLRSLLQDSITALFMAGVLGDISSISSLSVAIPTMLVESRYSREFELEADQYAIDYLETQNIAIEQYSKILSLLEQVNKSSHQFDYLSSHPTMDKRINIIQNRD